MRSCMHCLFSLSLGNEVGGVELVYVGHLFAGVEDYFDMRKIGMLSVFSLFFDRGWRVCRCMCVDARTHTLTASGYSGCELKGRDGTFREHEESKWTKTHDKYIRICVRSTHVYINAGRQDEIVD